jgi:hypothetical protein
MSHHAATSSSGIKDHRRTWDKSTYEVKAQERLAAEREELDIKRGVIKPPRGPKVQREMLKPREFKVTNLHTTMHKVKGGSLFFSSTSNQKWADR